MSDEPDSIILRYLHRIDTRMEELATDVKDMTARLIFIVEQVSLLRPEIGTMRADVVRMDHRIDRLDERMKRIEARLDLIQA
jgi:hypothetical protein